MDMIDSELIARDDIFIAQRFLNFGVKVLCLNTSRKMLPRIFCTELAPCQADTISR